MSCRLLEECECKLLFIKPPQVKSYCFRLVYGTILAYSAAFKQDSDDYE